jgi:hypothetical protein
MQEHTLVTLRLGLQTAIGGTREPVKCTECNVAGKECKIFQATLLTAAAAV